MRHLVSAPLRLGPQPPRPSPRLHHRRPVCGACTNDTTDGGIRFIPAGPITPDDLDALECSVRRRLIRWYKGRGFLDAEAAANVSSWEHSGFSIDASVRISLDDRDEQGIVNLSPNELLDRLADLVPPPRKHRHRYHGVLAPHHPLRPLVTAMAIGNTGKVAAAANGRIA